MNQFTKHPKEVNMSYLQHMAYAFTVAGRLGMITFCCLTHAVFPFLFTNTTSKIIKQLQNEFENRNNH
jgi:hypothetical protein